MLRTANTLKGYTLASLDGHMGTVAEFFFDDRHWTVRYLVADTGTWLTDRQVLISPHALVEVQEAEQRIIVALTNKQIEDSPALASDKPVSRQFEETYHGYYGWPVYWSGSSMWGPFNYVPREPYPTEPPAEPADAWDPYLRSTHDVSGHHIQAKDGHIGHVVDFVIDDRAWAIRYLIVDTLNWWPGKRVLIAPQWIEQVSWAERKVFVGLPRAAIKDAPEYRDGDVISPDYEERLHKHYGLPGYWVAEGSAAMSAR